MLHYNIDYTVIRKTGPEGATEEVESVQIGRIAGYSTPEQLGKAKPPKEGFSRLRADSASDVASLGVPIQRALYEFKAKDGKVPEGTADEDLAGLIWAMFEPAPKKDRKSPQKDLSNAPSDGISSVPGQGGPATEDEMKKNGKPAAKKKAAKKAKSNGTRGAKTLLVKNMLLRKNGCTRGEILKSTGWPTVSVQAMAKAAGLKLKVEKLEGKPKQYFGTEK